MSEINPVGIGVGKTTENQVRDRYFLRAQKWARILGKLPGVRAIFLSGSLARGDGDIDSDIDFFIVTAYGQIWTARFFVFFVLKLCSKLAKPHHHAGQICPNHFVTTESLEIKEKDEYAAKMFSRNIPLYDSGEMWFRFVRCNQCWVKKFGYEFRMNSNQLTMESQSITIKSNAHMSSLRLCIERFFKYIQITKIKSNPEFKTPNGCIILTDEELRFHPVRKNQM